MLTRKSTSVSRSIEHTTKQLCLQVSIIGYILRQEHFRCGIHATSASSYSISLHSESTGRSLILWNKGFQGQLLLGPECVFRIRKRVDILCSEFKTLSVPHVSLSVVLWAGTCWFVGTCMVWKGGFHAATASLSLLPTPSSVLTKIIRPCTDAFDEQYCQSI